MKADKKQMQIIHIAKTQLKLDDELYRETLQHYFNVSSASDLTWTQASALIDIFKSKGFKVKRQSITVKQGEKVVKLASKFQRELIEVLKANIVWRVENGYQAWLEKRMKIKNVVTAADAFKAIEGLKGMLHIKSKIIEMQALPFPVRDEAKSEGWFFDTQKGRLVQFNSANEETICMTK